MNNPERQPPKTATAFGEVLVDMVAMNPGSLAQAEGFLKKFGGAPANTAVGLARLGVPVSFLGKIGDDHFGHFLQSTLRDNGVDTQLVLDVTRPTTLAFVSLTASGERDFIFQVGAHEKIEPDEVNLPEGTFLFHFGSLTQVNSPARETTNKLISQAREAEAIISYDPNIREAIWDDLDKAKKTILETAKRVHILKVNEDEAALLSGTNDIQQAAQILFTDNLEALFITLGENGCYIKTRQLDKHLPLPIRVTVIDTTGAGDAFNAGYIYAIHKLGKRISEMSEDELVAALNVAMIIATQTTTQKGSITAFPTRQEVENLVQALSVPLGTPQAPFGNIGTGFSNRVNAGL